jgi:hypothetical protein
MPREPVSVRLHEETSTAPKQSSASVSDQTTRFSGWDSSRQCSLSWSAMTPGCLSGFRLVCSSLISRRFRPSGSSLCSTGEQRLVETPRTDGLPDGGMPNLCETAGTATRSSSVTRQLWTYSHAKWRDGRMSLPDIRGDGAVLALCPLRLPRPQSPRRMRRCTVAGDCRSGAW